MPSKNKVPSEVQEWCSDQLHSLLGFSDSHLAKYLVHVASRAKSVTEIQDTLSQGNVQASSDRQDAFCRTLFAKCQPKKAISSTPKTNADWVQKASQYSLLEEDEEDAPKMKSKKSSKRSSSNKSERASTTSPSTSKKERLREKKRRRRHQDSQSESSDDGGVNRESMEGRRERRRREEEVDDAPKAGDALTEEQRANLEREKDLRERDEFVQRMLVRDKSKTKQHVKEEDEEVNETKEAMEKRLDLENRLARGETVIGDDGKVLTLERLRVESRRAYLKKRQEREVNLLKQSLQDEEELFRDQKLTAAERKRIELGKKIIKMVETNENPDDKNDGFYRLPDEYNEGDTKGSQDQTLLSSRYVEPVKEKSEQELWEEAQTMKAAGISHKKKKAKDEKEYDLVFDDQIDFVMQETTKGYDKRDKKRRAVPDEPSSSDALVKKESGPTMTEHEKIIAGRKKLPVYPYREEFLAAVKEHQILILVGETGSG